MRAASPGDLVLSFADGLIRHVGRVAEFAFTAPKPEEFGSTGGYWNAVGWLLPVYWVDLARPVRPRELIATLGPLRSEEHTSELQSLMRISYAVFCLKKKKKTYR